MDEEATKEDVKELEPNATEEGTSHPRVVPADVAEASTLMGQLMKPPAPEVEQPVEAVQFINPPSS